MKKQKRVIISGYYGFDNSGDDAILKAIVKDLKAADYNLDIVALSNAPLKTEQTYGIKAIDRFNFSQLIKGLSQSDLLISGGGSLLQDVTSTRSIIYYLTLIQIAKWLKKPVMVYANGIGPIRKRTNRLLTKKILNKVDLITLRDANSKETIEDLGVKNDNVFITTDPVYSLDPVGGEHVHDILEKEGIPVDKPLVGISVRAWKNTAQIKKVLPKAIDYLKSNYDTNIVMIPMHYPEDLKISKEISEATKHQSYVLKNKYPVEEMMGVIRELDMMIAMRLHSLIYAASQAVPMVGIVYDPKVEGFMNTVELESKCDVEELELVELCTIIDKVWNERRALKTHLQDKKKEFESKAYTNVEMALELLKRR